MFHFLDFCFPVSGTVLLLFWFCFFFCFVFALNIIVKNMFKVRFEHRYCVSAVGVDRKSLICEGQHKIKLVFSVSKQVADRAGISYLREVEVDTILK